MIAPVYSQASLSPAVEEALCAALKAQAKRDRIGHRFPPSMEKQGKTHAQMAMEQKLLDLHGEGRSQDEIARQLGITRSRVSQIATQNGVFLRRKYEIGGGYK